MNQLTIANVIMWRNSLFGLFILNDRYILLEQFPATSTDIGSDEYFFWRINLFDLLQPIWHNQFIPTLPYKLTGTTVHQKSSLCLALVSYKKEPGTLQEHSNMVIDTKYQWCHVQHIHFMYNLLGHQSLAALKDFLPP